MQKCLPPPRDIVVVDSMTDEVWLQYRGVGMP